MTNAKSVDVEALRELVIELKEVARSERSYCSYFVGEPFDCKDCPADGNVLGCENEMLNHIACRIRETIEEKEEPEPVLASDGLPIAPGDTVYYNEKSQLAGEMRIVMDIMVNDKEPGLSLVSFNNGGFDHAHYLTHTPPEVLASDGLPIVVGEIVYGIPNGQKYTVNRIIRSEDNDGTYVAEATNERSYCAILNDIEKNVTHTPPDTQERIDADVLKNYREYWGCSVQQCIELSCPAWVDGGTPYERYNTDLCTTAKWLDLLRRQRELDARLMKGGNDE